MILLEVRALKFEINYDKKLKLYKSTEELSEEDQQLKNELDMLVERLTVSY